MKQLTGLSGSMVFTSTSMGGKSNLALKTALSFGILPLLSLGVFQLVKRFKNPGYPSRKLIMILSLVCVSYLIGFFCKVIFILISLDVIISEPISPNVKMDVPLNQLYFYDYALVFSIIAGLLVFLFARKRTDSQAGYIG
ncbi:MAG: hypothetical protein K0S23_1786 [Fluviicola sp.]|uniref:hypothetical protein n=1 Tax=Fluviicola sp. TaxID=1917219 RepID=UPI00260C9287|nr:hypothetical protein [Fluviicola sp.]MDF3027479.1 hypothetical protein [Fluviicola sp.]